MKKKQLSEMQKRAIKMLKQCHESPSIQNQDISQLLDELTVYQIELENQNEDLQKAQAALEEARNKYVELYEQAPVSYFSINKEGLIKEVNQAGCDLLGLKKQALINRCFARYIAPESQALFSQCRLRAFKEMTPQSCELKLQCWNKASFYAFLECKVIKNARTGSEQLLAFVSDISIRKLSEDTLHHERIKIGSIDRLRSLNELVFAIAEEQNHSVLMMNNYLSGCIRRLENGSYQPDELLAMLRKAVKQLLVLEDIIRSRKNFTSKSIFRYEYTSIDLIINQTLLLLAHEIRDFPMIIQYEATRELSKIKLDKFHIQHALLNLARNAMEAMRDSNIREPKLLIETAQISHNMIEVSLFDNGPGLFQEIIPKLFEPHFTTKSYSIGLGLTVSRAIIEKHGGQLFALPNPSGGACFGFTLPCLAVSQS